MKWYEKQAADVAHIKNFYEGRRARADFRLNERVGLACDINTAGGTLQRTAEGKIVEAKTDGSYVVDFGRHGKHLFEAEVAAKALYAIRKSDMRGSIRKTLATQVDEALTPGHRVKDADGRQYFIEQADVFGRTFQCLDERGRTRVLSKHEVEPVNEAEALPGGNPLALAPGSTVVVRGINPALNNIRARAILPAEASGIVGQTGILGFAYYPAGQGSTMYRVILQSGGMKDFSMEELAPAGGMMQANESVVGKRINTSRDGISPAALAVARTAGAAGEAVGRGIRNKISGKPSGFGVAVTTPAKGGSVTRSVGTYDDETASKTRLGVQVTRPVKGGTVTRSVGVGMKPTPPSKDAPSSGGACPHCGK